jgi:membrane protein
VLFTVIWILTSVLFGLYVKNFGSYSATYGALGGVIILLTWLYLTSFILLLGAEMNAIVDAEEDPAGFAARQQQVNDPAAAKGVKPYQPMDHMPPQPAPKPQRQPRPSTAGRVGAVLGAVVAGGLAVWQLSRQRH